MTNTALCKTQESFRKVLFSSCDHIKFGDLSHYQWSPTIGPHGPSAAAMDDPPRPCTAATLGPKGTIYGT